MKNHLSKHTRHTILIILLLAVAFGGCQSGVRVRGELAMLDSLVDVDYDSALSVLVQLDTRQMGKGERMYAQLLTGKAMNKADSLFTTDSVMKEVVRYFDRHGNSNQRMLAHYVLGCAYRDMGDAPRAIQCYQDAVEQADTTRSDCDLSTLMRVHSQMAEIFDKQKLYELEEQEKQVAKRIAWSLKDTVSALYFEKSICNSLYINKQYERCIHIADSFRQCYLDCGMIDHAAMVTIYGVKASLALNDYVKAKHYLDLYESGTTIRTNPSKIKGKQGPLLYYKGDYYMGIGSLDSALCLYKKALSCANEGNNSINIYSRLNRIYQTLQNPDSALKYSSLYVEAHKKKYDAEQMATMVQMQSLYGYNAESRKAEKEMERVAVLKKWGWGTSAAVVLLSLLLWNLRLRKDRKLLALSEEVRRMQKELIEFGSREKMHIQEENRRYEELTTSIREKERQIDILQQHVRIANGEDQATKLYQSDIVSVLRKCLRNGIQPREQEWNRLVHTVDSLFPAFRQQMNAQSTLKTNAYRVCMLTKSGFSSTEIDSLMGKASGYASHSKERLLKQIFGEDGKAGDFEERLMHDV